MEPCHTHSHTETKKVLDRLSRAIGHLEAIRMMVEAGRDCTEVWPRSPPSVRRSTTSARSFWKTTSTTALRRRSKRGIGPPSRPFRTRSAGLSGKRGKQDEKTGLLRGASGGGVFCVRLPGGRGLTLSSFRLDAGVRLLEYNGGKSYHCKTILIDDSLSVVGSFNYDMRSVYLDTELMLVIDSPSFHDLLEREMAAAAADSLVIPPDADNFSMLSGEASVGKKIALILMGLLSPVIRRLL